MSTLEHKDLTGANLHIPGYIASADPGAVGAGKLWVDKSGGAGAWAAKIRNDADSGWERLQGALTAADIPSLDASKIGSGTFDDARIPNLAASKVTSGTFDNARVNWAAPGAIGGTTPAAAVFSGLQVKTESASNVLYYQFGNNGAWQFYRIRNSEASPEAVLSGNALGLIGYGGYHGSGYGSNVAEIRGLASENWSSGALGTRIEFRTTPNTTTTPAIALIIHNDKSLEIEGDLNHDGAAYGLCGATPSAPQTGYTTFANLVTDRTCDANATSTGELADILGTLIVDLKAKGIIAA